MWLSLMGAARVGSKSGVFHAVAGPSQVDDALDAVGAVVKDGLFHTQDWALDAAEGARDKIFHVSRALDVLCDRLIASKGGAFHALPIVTADNGRLAPVAPLRLFPCVLIVADPPELCLIHCRMTNFPILIGYAADPRRWSVRPLIL